jgi:hypothetical protein
MGLPVGGSCPECGKRIEESRLAAVAREELLRGTVDAGWWGAVETGACIAGCGALMRVVFVLSNGKPSGELFGVMLFFGMIAGYGWWQVTRVRPGFEEAEGLERRRWKTRLGATGAEVLMAVLWMPMGSGVWRVGVFGMVAVAVWWAVRELYRYWPRVIGKEFVASRGAWGVCYAGGIGALGAAVVAMGFGSAFPAYVGMVCLAVGGGCYLGALLILCSAGRKVWEKEDRQKKEGVGNGK